MIQNYQNAIKVQILRFSRHREAHLLAYASLCNPAVMKDAIFPHQTANIEHEHRTLALLAESAREGKYE